MKNNYICKSKTMKVNIKETKMKKAIVPKSEICMAKREGLIDIVGSIYAIPITLELLSLPQSRLTTQNCIINDFAAETQAFIFENDGVFIEFKKLRKMVIRRIRIEKIKIEEDIIKNKEKE